MWNVNPPFIKKKNFFILVLILLKKKILFKMLTEVAVHSRIFRRLPAVPSRKQEGMVRSTRLCSRVGRMQPLLPLLLHVTLGQAKQSLPALPARMVYPTNGKIICRPSFFRGGIILPLWRVLVIVEKRCILSKSRVRFALRKLRRYNSVDNGWNVSL